MAFFIRSAENEYDMNWQLFYAGIVLLVTILSMLGTCQTFPIHLSRKDRIFDDYKEWFTSNQKCKHSKLLLSPNCILWGPTDDQKRMKRSRGKLTKTIKRFYSAATRRFLSPKLDWEVVPQAPDDRSEVLVCFVNSKSGGNQGLHVLMELRKLMHPMQVVDVSKSDPFMVLLEFAKLSSYKVLVCGGDGTVGWILDCVQRLQTLISDADLSTDNNADINADRKALEGDPLKRHLPIGVAILPIGTGNDLAIELGWGHCYMNEPLAAVLERILYAEPVPLDRWELRTFATPPEGTRQDTLPGIAEGGIAKRAVRFQNYCGVGVDAQIVLQFHEMRNEKPHMFFHRWVNKLWYGLMGWRELWQRNCAGFAGKVSLFVDGEPVALPAACQGVVLSNIQSYGGGSVLWEHSEEGGGGEDGERWRPASLSDGVIEVVAVSGSLELAQVKLGVARGLRLAQGRCIHLKVWQSVPVQTDGEPWIHNPRTDGQLLVVRALPQVTMLRPARSSAQDDGDSLLEVLLWAAGTHLISAQQHSAILQEFHQRKKQRNMDVTFS